MKRVNKAILAIVFSVAGLLLLAVGSFWMSKVVKVEV